MVSVQRQNAYGAADWQVGGLGLGARHLSGLIMQSEHPFIRWHSQLSSCIAVHDRMNEDVRGSLPEWDDQL